MSSKAPSNDEIKAGFQFQILDKIAGEPSYDTLRHLEVHVTHNATTVEISLPLPHTDLSGLVEQPNIYLLRTGAAFPRPVYPGNGPIYPGGSTAAQRANIDARYAHRLLLFDTCNKTEKLLKTMLENAIEPAYLSGIHTETHGFGARTLHDIFQHLYCIREMIGT